MFDKIKSVVPVNWDLMANPVNWIIIFLMVAIAGYGLAFITSFAVTSTGENENG